MAQDAQPAERSNAVADMFANAGLIAPGHAYAWASPQAPGMLLRSLYRDDQALRFRPSADPHLWAWSFRPSFPNESPEHQASGTRLDAQSAATGGRCV